MVLSVYMDGRSVQPLEGLHNFRGVVGNLLFGKTDKVPSVWITGYSSISRKQAVQEELVTMERGLKPEPLQQLGAILDVVPEGFDESRINLKRFVSLLKAIGERDNVSH